ncbi:MAG: sigma-70 family RNA polymerase sigma factor [Fimbriimonadales bacterium]|nr:sigma-70 family RNA polymerase sigma factor [Fimbriimonadales bacterium]
MRWCNRRNLQAVALSEPARVRGVYSPEMVGDTVSYNGRHAAVDTLSAELMLVERAQAQDETAFEQIMQLYADRLYNYVLRMVGNRADAEDIVQETFLRAYQGLPSFDRRASLSTWLYRIATNLCIDHQRRRARRVQTVSYADYEDDAGETSEWEFADTHTPSPMDAVLHKELQQVVEQAVATLSPKLKTVLLLYDVEELSYEEIARVLNIPMGTVKSRLNHARSQIQKQVEAYLRGETK